jgi:hypothetical protein
VPMTPSSTRNTWPRLSAAMLVALLAGALPAPVSAAAQCRRDAGKRIKRSDRDGGTEY